MAYYLKKKRKETILTGYGPRHIEVLSERKYDEMDQLKISTLQCQHNYHDWKFQVENMLKYYELTNIING